MTGRPPYIWIAATVLYTAFAVSVTAVVLTRPGSGPFGHPLVVAVLSLLLASPGVVVAYQLATAGADGGPRQ